MHTLHIQYEKYAKSEQLHNILHNILHILHIGLHIVAYNLAYFACLQKKDSNRQTGRERRHASCVGDEAGFEPRTSGTKAGALTTALLAPVDDIVHDIDYDICTRCRS